MEAAVANPNRWDAVARQVAGGRTPAECMQRFLSLAVEDVIQGNEKPPAAVPAAAAASAGAGATVEEAATTRAGGGGGTAGAAGQQAATAGGSSSNGNSAGAASGEGKDAGTTPDQGGSRGRPNQQQERPDYLGPTVPALVLASALVSSVHPEVLKAAMSAAADAADAAAAAATANHDRDRTFPPDGGSSGGEGAGVAAAVEGGSSRPREEDGDIEMPDVKDLAGPAPRSRPAEQPAEDTAPVTANGGRAASDTGAGEDGGVATGTPGSRGARDSFGSDSSSSLSSSAAGGIELASAARAAVLSVAGLQARGLAEQEERRTEALLADLLEARYVIL